MKLYKNALILLVIVILLSTIYFVIGKKKSIENLSNASKTGGIKILNFKLDTITEIDINNKEEKLVFLKSENKWKLSSPSDIKYDQTAADSLPLGMFYLEASKIVSEKATDIAQYGLDNPSSISVQITDGSLTILDIGNLTSSKDSYYSKIQGNDNIYIIDKNKIDSVLLTKKRIKDKNVLSLRRELRLQMLAEDIVNLTMEKNEKLVFSAVKNTDTGTWSLTSPLQSTIDKDKINPILNSISKVLALEFIDDNPANLDKYGLKKPAYSIEFQNSTGRKKLLIGYEKDIGSTFYAMVEGSNDVFSLDEVGFNFLDTPFRELIKK